MIDVIIAQGMAAALLLAWLRYGRAAYGHFHFMAKCVA